MTKHIIGMEELRELRKTLYEHIIFNSKRQKEEKLPYMRGYYLGRERQAGFTLAKVNLLISRNSPHTCQFPTFKYAPCGPWPCNKPAPAQRGQWHFCEEHAEVYDKENPPVKKYVFDRNTVICKFLFRWKAKQPSYEFPGDLITFSDCVHPDGDTGIFDEVNSCSSSCVGYCPATICVCDKHGEYLFQDGCLDCIFEERDILVLSRW